MHPLVYAELRLQQRFQQLHHSALAPIITARWNGAWCIISYICIPVCKWVSTTNLCNPLICGIYHSYIYIYMYVYLYVYYRGYHGLGCNPKQIVLKMISNSHNGTVCHQKTAVPHEPFISIHTQWTISCTSCESLGCLPTPALQKTFSITILPVYILSV